AVAAVGGPATPWRRFFPLFRRGGARVPGMAFAALLAFVIGAVTASAPGFAQNTTGVMHFPPRPPPSPRQPPPPSNAPMLVQATEISYAYPNNSLPPAATLQIYSTSPT